MLRESLRLNSRRLDSLRLNSRRLDSRRLNSRRLDSRCLDTIRLDSLRLDSRRLNSFRLDSFHIDSLRLDTIRLEPHRLTLESTLRLERRLLRHCSPLDALASRSLLNRRGLYSFRPWLSRVLLANRLASLRIGLEFVRDGSECWRLRTRAQNHRP